MKAKLEGLAGGEMKGPFLKETQGLIPTKLVKGSTPPACRTDTGPVSIMPCVTRACTLRDKVDILSVCSWPARAAPVWGPREGGPCFSLASCVPWCNISPVVCGSLSQQGPHPGTGRTQWGLGLWMCHRGFHPFLSQASQTHVTWDEVLHYLHHPLDQCGEMQVRRPWAQARAVFNPVPTLTSCEALDTLIFLLEK